jgi:hypothetical protein
VESEPRHGIDELTFAIDKVRDPERAITQKDRHFASLTQPQELTLNGARRPIIDVHGFLAEWFATVVQPVSSCGSCNKAEHSLLRAGFVMLVAEEVSDRWEREVSKNIQKKPKK